MKLLSVVVPLYNEEGCVKQLLDDIQRALDGFSMAWELVIVDDGSSDTTVHRLEESIQKFTTPVRIIALQRNFGQTAAMQAGIDAAQGEVIATLDGDLQNDPRDIPSMVHRLIDEELDLVVGWRKQRKDNVFLRKIPSLFANMLIAHVTRVKLHDYGCSLKIYRTSVIKTVRLYGEMHRFIPAWVATATAPDRVAEHVVHHHPRQHGESKYGLSRSFRVLLDLLSVYFFMRFKARPGHFFGAIGLLMGFGGAVIVTYLAIIKFGYGQDIGTRPLLLTGIMLIIGSIQLLTTGVVSELMARTYFESSQIKPYIIRRTIEKTVQETYETA